jgi:hypothetical protein
MHVVNGASAHELQLLRRRCASHWATGNLAERRVFRFNHRPQAKRVTPVS